MNSLAAQGKWSKILKVNKKNLYILFLQNKINKTFYQDLSKVFKQEK